MRLRSQPFCFNPRVREGRDGERAAVTLSAMFQSTRPRGTRRPCSSVLSFQYRFNPRVREGRDQLLIRLTTARRCFNPRVREGRDVALYVILYDLPRFNPRVREGRDRAGRKNCSTDCVSIHASARDATSVRPTVRSRYMFQSTRPRGTRRRHCSAHTTLPCFNPRVREGRDLHSTSLQKLIFCFNPRVREGRDLLRLIFRFPLPVSIHASARDATSPQRSAHLS